MTLAMFRVMALELWRDRGALVMTFLLPPLVFLIFSAVFAGTTGEDIKLKLVVADEARTADSARLVKALLADPDLRAETAEPGTGAEVRRMVRAGRADAGLIVRSDPELGKQPILIISDPSRAVAAPLTMARVQQALSRTMPDVLLARTLAETAPAFGGLTPQQQTIAGIALDQAGKPGFKPPEQGLFAREDVAGAKKGGGTIAYYAGAVTILFALFSAMHGALSLIEERRSGVADRILAGAAGMAPVVNGKFLFLMAQSLIQATAIFATAQVIYQVPVTSHLLLWLITTVLVSACAGGLAMAVVAFCKTRDQAQMLSTFVILILAAIGGSMVPRFLMPPWLQTIGWGTPHAWAIEAYQSILWRDGGVGSVYIGWIVLGGVALAGLAIAHIAARRVR
ncbi:MAG: ABC transporter permease [Caulobacter sp.]|nr:ABC transporter permease [Caulobacter sp.]